MVPMSDIRETDLPGIGRKFQVEARSGDKLVIVVHDDGRRELYHFDQDDPDDCISMVTLDDTEARQVAGILGGMSYRPKALDTMGVALADLHVEWHKLEPRCKAAGRTIGDLKVRQRTGATIIAVVDKDHTKIINPGPEQVLREGATLVMVGERPAIQALKQLLATGSA